MFKNPFRSSVTVSLPSIKILLQSNVSESNNLKITNNKFILLLVVHRVFKRTPYRRSLLDWTNMWFHYNVETSPTASKLARIIWTKRNVIKQNTKTLKKLQYIKLIINRQKVSMSKRYFHIWVWIKKDLD